MQLILKKNPCLPHTPGPPPSPQEKKRYVPQYTRPLLFPFPPCLPEEKETLFSLILPPLPPLPSPLMPKNIKETPISSQKEKMPW